MPYREKTYKDNFYHLYNRGNNYENIFFEEKNYFFFINRITKYFEDNIEIIAYALMPNHYHFIIKSNLDDYLEIAMQKFSTSYTKAINKSLGRVGHLFQGRYKTKLVPENNYLLHLSRYIHLNPVRANFVRKPEEWKFSSYQDYVGLRNSTFLHKSIITDQIEDYRDFVNTFDDKQNYFVNKLLFK